MKRWQVITGVGGLLAVVAFAVRRFSQVPASSFYLSDDLKPDLVSLAVWGCVVAVISVGAGDLLWNKLWRKSTRDVPQARHLSVGRRRYLAKAVVVSIPLAVFAEILSGMRTPGALARRLFLPMDVHSSAGAYLVLFVAWMMPAILDTAILLAISWGGYLLWEARRKKSRGRLGVGS
jgi:uncharacterized membrane protein